MVDGALTVTVPRTVHKTDISYINSCKKSEQKQYQDEVELKMTTTVRYLEESKQM